MQFGGRALASSMIYHLDAYTLFCGHLWIKGWAVDFSSPIQALELCAPGGQSYPLTSWGTTSPDVEAVHGPEARACRFEQMIALTPETQVSDLILRVSNKNGTFDVTDVCHAQRRLDPANQLIDVFQQKMRELPARGRMLEIGARARSGIVHKGRYLPEKWNYVGFDILPGENVDVVGDAHKLSTYFEPESVDAVIAISVFEHLLMPWKVVIEINKVLRTGGLIFFSTHQSWPLHDYPSDFWRISSDAWSALFNKATGFEIMSAQMGQPAQIIPMLIHPVVDFGPSQFGWLASNVVARKVASSRVDWPVDVEEIASLAYPC
jgi:hypothetical protein